MPVTLVTNKCTRKQNSKDLVWHLPDPELAHTVESRFTTLHLSYKMVLKHGVSQRY